MLGFLISIFTTLLCLIVSVIALRNIFNVKVHKYINFKTIIFTILYILVSTLLINADDLYLLIFNMMYQITILYVLLDASAIKKIMLIIIILLFESCIQALYNWNFHIYYQDYFSVENFLDLLIRKSIELIIVYVISYFKHQYTYKYDNDKKPYTYIYYLMNLCMGVVLFILVLQERKDQFFVDSRTIGVAYIIIISNIMLSLIYISKNRENRRFKKQVKIDKVLIDAQTKHIENVAIDFQKLRILKHDINAYLQTIDTLIIQEKYDELRCIVSDINTLTAADTISDCTNIFIASTINQLLPTIEEHNISFCLEYNVSDHIQMVSIELCSLFHNLLNNAVEAVSNLDKRDIKISVDKFKSNMIIQISNTVTDNFEVKNLKNNITTKLDKDNHGIGLISIDNIIKKYQGNIDYTVEDNTLNINILLQDIFR